jgi:hypothetical protein
MYSGVLFFIKLFQKYKNIVYFMVTPFSLVSSNIIYETSNVVQNSNNYYYYTDINPYYFYLTNINPYYNLIYYNYYNYITTYYGYPFTPIDPLYLSVFGFPYLILLNNIKSDIYEQIYPDVLQSSIPLGGSIFLFILIFISILFKIAKLFKDSNRFYSLKSILL